MKRKTAIIIFLVVALICIIVFALSQLPAPEEKPIHGFHAYADPNFTQEITWDLGALDWTGLHLGFNNQTIWGVNNGSYPVMISLNVYMLPENWTLTLSYNDSLIMPNETRSMLLTLYIPYWIDIEAIHMQGYFVIDELVPV